MLIRFTHFLLDKMKKINAYPLYSLNLYLDIKLDYDKFYGERTLCHFG